jgi:opacity protein-like surface antigen
MKRLLAGTIVCFPLIVFSQWTIKAGAAAGNRWSETLNTQTAGKGFRVAAEQFSLPRVSIGLGISYFSFNPNKSVNVRFNSYSMQCVYYFTANRWQPYLGAGIGYTRYTDRTTIVTGTGNMEVQSRKKNYGLIAPFLGLQYSLHKKQHTAVFLQLNTDLVPVAGIPPIGFLSLAAGISCQLPRL